MPQFELEPAGEPATFVRARTDLEAVERHARGDVVLEDAEAGSGWRAATVDGEPWGRVRPRGRMRFRRD